MKAENVLNHAVYAYVLALTSTPEVRAALIRSTICGILPQLDLPAAFKCQISTGMFTSRPIRVASSIDSYSASPSLRMCGAGAPPGGGAAGAGAAGAAGGA